MPDAENDWRHRKHTVVIRTMKERQRHSKNPEQKCLNVNLDTLKSYSVLN